MAERKGIDNPVSHPLNDAESNIVAEAAKKANESRLHDEETHGRSDDIDKNTKIDEVKAPSVVQRAWEEVEAVAEAVVDAVRPKK